MREKRSLTIVSITLVTALLVTNTNQVLTPAYSHGLHSDEAIPAKLGDRSVTVLVKMAPAMLLAEKPQEAIIDFIFKDVNTGNPVPHVTYFIKIDKDGRTLLSDWFHDHEGDLQLKIRPKNTATTTVFGEKEPILGGWLARGGPVLAEGPIFLEGGLHTFTVEVFSIDNDSTPLPEPLSYNAYVSIGETTTYAVDGQDLGIRTYYDKIKEFKFDEENKLITFSMPFNWNIDYVNQVPLVHEEVLIPTSLEELASETYTGTINGFRLPKNAVMVDTSDPKQYIVHYMITNPMLMQLANTMSSNGMPMNTAEFVLAPGEADIGVPLMGGDMQAMAPGMMMSSKGSFNAMLSWSPSMIEPGKPASFSVGFSDAKTGRTLNDLTYDFVIFKDGKEIVKRAGKTVGNVASEQFTFTESHVGSVTLTVDNVNNSGESVQFTINVVPEFPLGPILAMAGMVAVIITITSFRKGLKP